MGWRPFEAAITVLEELGRQPKARIPGIPKSREIRGFLLV